MTTPEEIIARVFGINVIDVTDETSSETVEGWDSLAHVNLVLELEKEFDISIAPGDALEMNSVSSIKEVLGDYDVSF